MMVALHPSDTTLPKSDVIRASNLLWTTQNMLLGSENVFKYYLSLPTKNLVSFCAINLFLTVFS